MSMKALRKLLRVLWRTRTSASMNTSVSPQARSAPRFRAYAGPNGRPAGSRTRTSAKRAAIPGVASVLASSTTMSSQCSRGRSLRSSALIDPASRSADW
jgi:hypothetical protein